jgi:hypothetical protein
MAAAPTSVLPAPQVPVRLVQLDRVRGAVDVAGEVLRRPADLQQRLLEPAPLRRVDDDAVLVDAGTQHGRHPLRSDDLLEHRAVGAGEHQPVHRVVGQGEPAEAVHGVGDVDQQRVRHRVAGETHQRIDDLLGVVPGGAGVPQRERGDPVGVHVLGGALQLRERRDGRAALAGQRMVDLEEQGLVRLDDQGAVTQRRNAFLQGSAQPGPAARNTGLNRSRRPELPPPPAPPR